MANNVTINTRLDEQHTLNAADSLQRALKSVASSISTAFSGANAAAKAQLALAKATAATTKAMKSAISGFDELHSVTLENADEANSTAAKKGSSGSKSSGKGSSGKGGKGGNGQDADECDWLSRLGDWVMDAFAKLKALLLEDYLPSILAWGEAFTRIGEAARTAFAQISADALALWNNALAPLGDYIIHGFLPSIVNGFSVMFAPIFADVMTSILRIVTEGFHTLCGVLTNAINTLIQPALMLVSQICNDIFSAITSTWNTYGEALLQGFETAFSGIFGILESLYYGLVQPLLASLLETVETLWTQHLAPMFSALTDCLAAAGEALLALWNEVLAPLAAFLIDTCGPVLAAFGGAVMEVFGAVAGTVADVVSGILASLRGVLTFLTGVFTGDWARAWQGVRDVFGGVWNAITSLLKGAINSIISCINGLIRGVVAGLNAVIGALNSVSVTIPDWVPGFGGQSFGVSIPSISAPQIPHLARGAVIPANKEFLAVLGDQTAGRNLEAPESLIRQIVREESGGQSVTVDAPIELSLDGNVFYRAMLRVKAQRGAAVGGVYADVF